MSQKRRLAAAIVTVLLLSEEEDNIPKKKRSCWVKPWVSRKHFGLSENLMRELALEDPDGYRRWLRIDVNTFDFLIDKLTPLLRKEDTIMRKAIPVITKLAVCLRFLATGKYEHKISKSYKIK